MDDSVTKIENVQTRTWMMMAGIVGARHCNTRIVTACVDAINFHRKIKKGNPQPNPNPNPNRGPQPTSLSTSYSHTCYTSLCAECRLYAILGGLSGMGVGNWDLGDKL